MFDRQRCRETTKFAALFKKPDFSTNKRIIYARLYSRRDTWRFLKVMRPTSRGMSGLGAVICSWEDEGGVTDPKQFLGNKNRDFLDVQGQAQKTVFRQKTV